MDNNDDKKMIPPGSPTPSLTEIRARVLQSLARTITIASDTSPKKQKVEDLVLVEDQEQYSGYGYDEDHKQYIPEDDAIVLTNFAYPELITQHDFGKLLKLGIQSDLIEQIKENMEKEDRRFAEYYQNRKMCTNWFWLHENIDSDSNLDSVAYDDGMVIKSQPPSKSNTIDCCR